MTITVRKAGEALVKAAAAPSSSGLGRLVLRPPRAVTAMEAPSIQPSTTVNTTTTLMPWNGWLGRFLVGVIGPDRYERIRTTLTFMPDDIYDGQQAPKPSKAIPISKTDSTITHMYRYPSPGSQPPVRLPEFDDDEDPFDTGYFKRDTRRRYLSSELGNPTIEKLKLSLMDPNDPAVQEEIAKVEAGPSSSPGNKGRFATGPTNFDPTGLRASMSVSWKALEESLDRHMPDHLPTPVWFGKEQEIIQWHEERNLPVPVGAYYTPLKIPTERRVARW